MNYYIEMIKDFVMSEMKKPNGCLMDDGEYVFASGLVAQRLTRRERQDIATKKRQILSEVPTLSLLSIEINHLIHESEKKGTKENEEILHLIHMVQSYQPQGDQMDQILYEAMQEGLMMPLVYNRYERQERYQKKTGLVSKTYKLNGQIVEEFAMACKQNGVPLGPTLTDLMLHYIESSKST